MERTDFQTAQEVLLDVADLVEERDRVAEYPLSSKSLPSDCAQIVSSCKLFETPRFFSFLPRTASLSSTAQ